MMSKIHYLCIGGYARVGKDSLAKLLKQELEKKEYRVLILPLADPLKQDTRQFLLDNFSVDSFTTNTIEKTFIRDFLVVYGDMKRRLSKGTYFTQKLEESLDKVRESFISPDFVIVPDCRYADSKYPDDELFFFKRKNAFIINVDRIKEDGTLVEPANNHEKINGPIIKESANYQLVWQTYNGFHAKMEDQAKNIVNEILQYYDLQ